jgi:hypothetical protein
VKVLKVKHYIAFGRWQATALKTFNVEHLHGLFELDMSQRRKALSKYYDFSHPTLLETFKPHSAATQDTLAQFTRMLECNQVVQMQRGGEFLFDYDADKVVVHYNR